VRSGRTAKARKRMTKSLECVFRRGTRQRAHGSILHSKVPLPCAACLTTRGELCLPCVTERHTTKKATDGAGAKRRVTVFVVRRKKKHMAITGLCRAPEEKTHGNNRPLPCAIV
jgi:hypothetical protein